MNSLQIFLLMLAAIFFVLLPFSPQRRRSNTRVLHPDCSWRR